ncbi:MAG: CHAT domain-containing protein, partial [Trichodesmium sp. St15_bin1_1]|nr:CHAT domain-containing protein [Trichodesmium sp. St15_bin1_1]
RQQLDPQGLQWLDELDNIHGQLSTLLNNRPENLPLETYRDNFAKLKQQAKELENKISRRSSEFRTSTQPVTLEAIQQLIPANAALVEFIQYSPYDAKTRTWEEPRYGVYVLGAEGEPQGMDLGTVEDIKSALDKFRVFLKYKTAPLKELKKTARELDEKLMQPVRQLIGSKEQILISPDSYLNLIPFEALVDENNQYLVENYSITYLSSGRDLLQLTTKARKTSAAVLLGDPNYGKKDKIAPHRSFNKTSSNIALPRLLETADEVKAIGKLLGVKPLLREAATEKAIKQAQNPFLLHIATHGLFKESKEKPQNPGELPIIDNTSLLRSGLALAGFKEENI